MINVDILLEYMRAFRLECHFRLDMVSGSTSDLPIFIYEASHKVSKEKIITRFDLSEEEGAILDKVSEFFITTIKEKDHYGDADDITVEAIEEGEFC